MLFYVKVIASFILRRVSGLSSPSLRVVHIMHTITRTVLVVAFFVPVLLLPVINYGRMGGTILYDEMMGGGSTCVIGWMLLPTMFCAVLDVVLFSHLFGKKHV
jgi:hypothetical protein